MQKVNRGDKLYLDSAKTEESAINTYLDARDGIVEVYEYIDDSGYGETTRLFLCQDTKHESVNIIRQRWNSFSKKWIEEYMCFDSDSFTFLKALITGKTDEFGGQYSVVRDYNEEKDN